jgi:hypothetical protein
MSHYRKKAYKKNHPDNYYQKEMKNAIKNEIEYCLDAPIEDIEPFVIEEPLEIQEELIEGEEPLEIRGEIIKDEEPDIVTLLKVQEKLGILPMWKLNKKNKKNKKLDFIETIKFEESSKKPNYYEDALVTAKKVIKQIYG